MLYRAIVFTNAPLLEAFRYKDQFQLVPFFYFKNARFSEYTTHFPVYMEYEAEEIEVIDSVIENNMRAKGIDESVLKLGRTIPNQTRVRRELLHVLSTLTNFHFFEYSSPRDCWGIQVPDKNVEKLTKEEIYALNNAEVHWTKAVYTYKECGDDLKCSTFTNCNAYIVPEKDGRVYFTQNPNIENNPIVKLPPYLEFCLDRYYSMDGDLRRRVRHCLGLLYDGIELFDHKRSVSLMAIVSSLEGMAKLDFELYGQVSSLGATNRFIRYLKRYVAGLSEDKYRIYYKTRCDIAHDGHLFIGDDDLYSDIEEQDKDWRLRLETLQVARLAFYNWLRRKEP